MRDNHPGAGGHAWDEMVITVSGAPFAVTSPNGGNSIDSAQPFTVTWNVGGGGIAPTVNVLLSTDGGAVWTPLASNTANDGSETVTYVTASTSSGCRIKVEAVGNIFYGVSNADFTILGHPTAVQLSEPPRTLAITAVGPNPAVGLLRIEYSNPRTASLRLTVLDLQGRVVATLMDGVVNAGRYRVAWTGDGFRAKAPGLYFVRIDSEGASAVRRVVVTR